jgi:hypothetical protein
MPSFVDTVKYAFDPGNVLGLGNRAPRKQYYGGSPEALEERRETYEAGRSSGAAQVQGGLDQLGQAGGMARGNAALGAATYGYGLSGASQARSAQNSALTGLLGAAMLRGPSMAEAQQRVGLSQLQGAMNARAADARGGNQAAAMRSANAAGSQMGLGLLERQGVLRAQEEDARMQRELGARGLIANAYGQQVGQDYGLLGLGLGTMGQATSQVGSFGAEAARIGAGREGAYLGARQAVDASQLDADMGRETARYSGQQAMMGGAMGTAGGIVGSIYGGPVGGAAGQQAGQNVGSGQGIGGGQQVSGQTQGLSAFYYDPYGNPYRTVA